MLYLELKGRYYWRGAYVDQPILLNMELDAAKAGESEWKRIQEINFQLEQQFKEKDQQVH